jgi:glycosyltransferase involved in cell wall biosynthesis
MVNSKCFILVVPLFNEESRIDLRRFRSFIYDTQTKVVFVDDGSTDGTHGLLSREFSTCDDVYILRLEKNSGKAEALRIGFLFAHNLEPDSFLVTFDADWSMGEGTVYNLIKEVEKAMKGGSEPDEIVRVFSSARIYLAGMQVDRPVSRKWIGRIIATIISLGIGITFYDPQSPLKIYKFGVDAKEIFSKRMRTRWFFEGELFLRLRSSGITSRVYEYPASDYLDIGSPNYKALLKLRVLKDFFYFFVFVIRDRVKNVF